MRFKGLIIAGLIIASTASIFSGCAKNDEPTKAEYANSLTVSVTGGKIKGTTNADKSVAIYKGVPYAAAPVGNLRWKAPQPVEEWEGELDCTLWGANALQGEASVFSYWTEEFIQDTDPTHYRGGTVYSEDCLTLNVFSSYSVTENKPVLVYIHGGGYNSGGASCEVYDGESIASKDVVFVSIQYRLGALGFMATQALLDEDENSSAGNYGLSDQIAALEWVQDNIKTFGGNPDNVTVMGQSAGGGAVNSLISSPLSYGLFKNAVSLSCSPIIPQSLETVQKRVEELNLNYNGKKLSEMTCEELRSIPSEYLAGKSLTVGGPCVDNYVLKDSFVNSVRGRTSNSVNLMTGNVAQDDSVLSFAKVSGTTPVEVMLGVQNALGKIRSDAGENNTFVYMFDRDVPKATSITGDSSGAKHSYELAYFFGNFSTASGRQWTQTDYDLGEVMQTCLINFCKSGNPTGGAGIIWKANVGDYNYMNFGDTTEIKTMDESKTKQVTEFYSL